MPVAVLDGRAVLQSLHGAGQVIRQVFMIYVPIGLKGKVIINRIPVIRILIGIYGNTKRVVDTFKSKVFCILSQACVSRLKDKCYSIRTYVSTSATKVYLELQVKGSLQIYSVGTPYSARLVFFGWGENKTITAVSVGRTIYGVGACLIGLPQE
jgi:hypothetical protein